MGAVSEIIRRRRLASHSGDAVRVCLFTDTLGDINGVSRFIRNVAEQALSSGRDLRVVTSTKFEVPDRENIINIPTIVAGKMPKYENLEFVTFLIGQTCQEAIPWHTRRVGERLYWSRSWRR